MVEYSSEDENDAPKAQAQIATVDPVSTQSYLDITLVYFCSTMTMNSAEISRLDALGLVSNNQCWLYYFE